ncbi:MAG: hypothetical protein GXO08_00505 [Aquificae bacterium]|nr:hypothetical protein [Aquificota bacterium]
MTGWAIGAFFALLGLGVFSLGVRLPSALPPAEVPGVANATVKIYEVSENGGLLLRWVEKTGDLPGFLGRFDPHAEELRPSKLYLYAVEGGCYRNPSGENYCRRIKGTFHAFAWGKTVRDLKGEVRVSPLTELLFEGTAKLVKYGFDPERFEKESNWLLGRWLDDVDGDGKVDLKDALTFDARRDREKLKSGVPPAYERVLEKVLEGEILDRGPFKLGEVGRAGGVFGTIKKVPGKPLLFAFGYEFLVYEYSRNGSLSLLSSWQPPALDPETGECHYNSASFIVSSPDGRLVFLRNSCTWEWDKKLREDLVYALDVSDPTNPKPLGALRFNFTYDEGVLYQLGGTFDPVRGRLYLEADESGVLVYEFKNKEFKFVKAIRADEVVLSKDGRYAYLINGSEELLAVDAQTLKPVKRLKLPLEGAVISLVFSPDGRRLYAGTDAGALGIFDASDPLRPKLLKRAFAGVPLKPIESSPDLIYSSGNLLRVGEETELFVDLLWDYYGAEFSHEGNLAFLVSFPGSVEAAFTGVSTPHAVRAVYLYDYGDTLDARRNLFFAVEEEEGNLLLKVYEVGPDFSLQPVARAPITAFGGRKFFELAASKGLLFVKNGNAVAVYDAADPKALRPLGILRFSEGKVVALRANYEKNFALVLVETEGAVFVRSIGLNERGLPAEFKTLRFENATEVEGPKFTPDGAHAFLAVDEKLLVLETADPSSVKVAGDLLELLKRKLSVQKGEKVLKTGDGCLCGCEAAESVPFNVESFSVDSFDVGPGGLLAAVSYNEGIILDVSDPLRPRFLSTFVTHDGPDVFLTANGKMVLADYHPYAGYFWELWDLSDPKNPKELGRFRPVFTYGEVFKLPGTDALVFTGKKLFVIDPFVLDLE